MSRVSFWPLAAVAVALIAGCSSTPKATKGPAPAVENRPPPISSSTPRPSPAPAAATQPAPSADTSTGRDLPVVTADGGQASTESSSTMDPLSDPGSLLSKRVVYFDFDMSDLQPEALPILNAHAAYLVTHPDTKVSLEGHADERGSREYNMALGERRANSVQQFMMLKGVAAKQVEAVSYGEERPAATEQDESAYSLNRRVEIVYGN